MNKESNPWPSLVRITALALGGWCLHALITRPPGPRRPDAPAQPAWVAVVGTGASRHRVEIYGCYTDDYVRDVLQRDRECPSPDARVRELTAENQALLAKVRALDPAVQALTAERVRLQGSLTQAEHRGQQVIEAVVRSGGGSYDWDDPWLAHYGLVRTWPPKDPYWQGHLDDELPFAQCNFRR